MAIPRSFPPRRPRPSCPVSPYGVSKLAGEYYLRALAALRGFEGIAMRYANVFGPRQDPKSEAGVVSIFVSRLLAGQPLTVFGDGRQTRDYVFVKDVARANVLASTVHGSTTVTSTRRPSTSPPRCSGTCWSWPARSGRSWGRSRSWNLPRPRAGELLRSALDVSKAKRVLGWTSAVRFRGRARASWSTGSKRRRR